MASIKKHARSPYWILRYRDTDSGEWRDKSTGCRVDNPHETRKAQRMADQASIREVREQAGARRDNPAFRAWVSQYLESHYANKAPGSLRRYTAAWDTLREFLAAYDVINPAQVRYKHAALYMSWRAKSKRKVCHNTALLELKFLAQLMNEAVHREFITANPLFHLGIKKAHQKEKPELSNEDIATLRAAFKKRPEWMRIAFEISLYTGCRFSECEIPMQNVDFENNCILIRDAKRDDDDPKKYFTVPIHPNLRGTLEELRDKKATVTCLVSPRDRNRCMNIAIRKAGIDATFHALRVTFITRCQRGGLSQSESMRLVNHSSTLVHRIYSRMNVKDAQLVQAKIPLPPID